MIIMESIAKMSNTRDVMSINAMKPNLAMIKFVKGGGAAKDVRHMGMRMWYIRA
jgi:hypothetical protein